MSIECADKERPRSDSGLESEKKAVEGRRGGIRSRVRGFVRLFGFFGGAPLRIRNVAFLVLVARCLRLLLYISAAVWELLCSKPPLVHVPLSTIPLPRPPFLTSSILSMPPSVPLCLAILCIFAHTFGSFWQSQRSEVPSLARFLSLSISVSLSDRFLVAFLLRS